MHESEKGKWSRSVVSDSQRPHGLQPTRLLCPWDFPGKITGVGCHCLLRAYCYWYINKLNSHTIFQGPSENYLTNNIIYFRGCYWFQKYILNFYRVHCISPYANTLPKGQTILKLIVNFNKKIPENVQEPLKADSASGRKRLIYICIHLFSEYLFSTFSKPETTVIFTKDIMNNKTIMIPTLSKLAVYQECGQNAM